MLLTLLAAWGMITIITPAVSAKAQTAKAWGMVFVIVYMLQEIML